MDEQELDLVVLSELTRRVAPSGFAWSVAELRTLARDPAILRAFKVALVREALLGAPSAPTGG